MLVPVTGRVQVTGTTLIVYGNKYINSDNEVIFTDLSVPLPMWKFAFEENQRDVVIIPSNLIDIEIRKNYTYRIVQLKDKFLWIERMSTTSKLGLPYQNNTFLLMCE